MKRVCLTNEQHPPGFPLDFCDIYCLRIPAKKYNISFQAGDDKNSEPAGRKDYDEGSDEG